MDNETLIQFQIESHSLRSGRIQSMTVATKYQVSGPWTNHSTKEQSLTEVDKMCHPEFHHSNQ